MLAVTLLRNESELAWRQLKDALKDIDERKSWAQINLTPDAYLNTNGTILGLVQHLAVCRMMYGSIAFRETEIRWRDCFDRLDKVGTYWNDNLAYLEEAQAYWTACWSDLEDADLESEVNHFSGKKWPTWKILVTVIQHDAYHAGQIALLGSALLPADAPPDMRLEEERGYVRDLPDW